MDDVWGAKKHHPLGFKRHPLEDAGTHVNVGKRNSMQESNSILEIVLKHSC